MAVQLSFGKKENSIKLDTYFYLLLFLNLTGAFLFFCSYIYLNLLIEDQQMRECERETKQNKAKIMIIF
jgi:hypothetical protein